ncbi:MAG: T9SS type A sorting domain-containing protein [Prevotellaceae bacterium]|jgi:hypothetical protein|nr:T9SS type A sorting domain-containing protein [Prevotellaceae bacterium]
MTLLIIVLSFYSLNGQVQSQEKERVASTEGCNISLFPYEESAEDETALWLCWTNYSAAATEQIWEVSTNGGHSGPNALYHKWGSEGVYLDNWLVSPKISIPAEGIHQLSFWSWNEYPDWYPQGGNSVWISESGADPTSANNGFVEIWSPASVSDSWVETKLSLENYAGKDIYIAFRYNATYTHGWYVDDIKINKVVNVVCAVTEFPCKEGWEDDATLPCWNFYDYDGDGAGVNWQTGTEYSHSGNRSIHHSDHYSIHQDGWLVSPKISVPTSGHSLLSFWSYNRFYTLYDTDLDKRNSLLISEGSGDPESGDFEQVWSPDEVIDDWVQTKIDLDEYAGKDIYIAFRYEGQDAHQWWLDDFQIEQISDFDAGVTAILSPRDGEHSTTEKVKIKVKNYGIEPLTNVPVKLKIDNIVVLTGNVLAVAREEEIEYEFTETVDLSEAKTYTLKAFTELPDDAIPENDTATATVISVTCQEPSFPYEEGAEDVLKLLCWTNYAVAQTTDNVWGAYSSFVRSGTKSIGHNYNDAGIHQDDWFVSPKISIPAEEIYQLSFWSYNDFPDWYPSGGNSVWISQGNADPASADNGFVEIWSPASVSDSWVETKLPLTDYAGKDIYIAFRYNATIAHGWYVDDISIDKITGADAGVTAIISPVSGENRSTEETITIRVKNFGSLPLSDFPVKAEINETTVIEGSIPDLPVNAEVEYSFPTKANLSEVKDYNIKVYTLVENDIDSRNDTATVTVTNNGNVAVIGTDATVTACNIQFMDDGMSGNYFGPPTDGKETQTITFYPAISENRLKVEFTSFFSKPFETHEWFGTIYKLPGDTLFIYSGSAAAENELLAALSGDLTNNLPPAIRSRAADGSLTFVFDKHKNTEAPGWEASVLCFEPHPQDAGVNKIIAPLAGGNQAAQVKVLIENYGSNAVSAFPVAYSLNGGAETVENFTGTIAPRQTAEFTFESTVDLTEYKTFNIKSYTKLPNDGDISNDTASVSFNFLKNVTLYGYRLWDAAYEDGTMTMDDLFANVSFSSYNPETVTTEYRYRDNGNVICAAEYVDGFIYGYTGNGNYESVNFVKLKSDWTEVSKVSAPNILFADITYDYSTNTMYALTLNPQTLISVLNTVNMENGALAPVVSLPASTYLFTLAADLNGQLYGIERSGYLVTVDKTTGELTPVGDTEILPAYLQSMTFDHNTGRLFWAMYDLMYDFDRGRLVELNPQTGAATDLGKIGNNAEIAGLYTVYSHTSDWVQAIRQDYITVYPNPATGAVYVSSVPDNSSLSIIDLSGKTLETYASVSGTVRLDLNLGSGLYFIRIENSNRTIMKKLLVK